MKPRLYLVDAHAYLHRAYHALPPLTNSRGEPVGALYGFARMLIAILKREKPEGVAVCFDSPGPTFRHELYPAYKATRKEIDPDLVSQLGRARELAEAMGFACAQKPGYEADDLMATMARRGAREGYEAVLVTGDKDALQLVGPGVRVLKDVVNGVWMDPPQIKEKLGVGPESVVDYLALTGDSVDNVPGVRGVGPVGAVKLLSRFKTIDGVIAAAKKADPAIPPKTAQAILEGEKGLRDALRLLSLAEDAPFDLEPKECGSPQADPARLSETLGRLEFASLIKELVPGVAPAASHNGAAGTAERRTSSSAAVAERVEVAAERAREAPFAQLAAALKGAKALTVVGARNSGRDLAADSRAYLGVGLEDGRVALLDEEAVKAKRADLGRILGGKAVKAGWDLKETLAAADALGVTLEGPLFDTMLARWCLDPARPEPAPPVDMDWKASLLERAGRALGRAGLRERMEEAGVLKLFEEIEMPLVPVLRAMEEAGVGLDELYLRKLGTEFEAEIASLKAELDGLAGFPINVNSPKQLGELLFDKLGLPVVHKTAKGGRSTDEEVLRTLAPRHPIPAKVLDYRELTKLKSTYIEGLLERRNPDTQRLHTRFDQTGTETGRLSSLNPNLQNIPIRSPLGQRIRRAIAAPRGWRLVSADYSQIDLRVLAHVSGDPVLREAFARGEDVHARTASEIFHVPPEAVDKEMRRRAKAVNFGIVYGQTAFGLAAELGIPQSEAAGIIRRTFERYKGVAEWAEKNLAEARREGFARTFLGRRRRLPELSAKNTALRQFGERAARNTPIQGGSADIIKIAMIRIHEGLSGKRFKARMVLQVHDELLFEAPEAEAERLAAWVREAMEGAVKLGVPLVVDVKAGRNWQDMEALA